MNIFIIIFLFLFIIKSLDVIYIFQIKEYRFDRLLSALHDWGIGQTLYLRSPRLPAKSLRNGLLAIWLVIGALLMYTFFQKLTPVSSLIFIAIIPFIVFLWTGVGVILTSIPAQIKRQSVIHKAANMLSQLPELKRVGITGCFGKTTTKEFLTKVLSYQFAVAQTNKNWNTDVGVALSVLSAVQSNTQYFVAEVGGYRKAEIQAISEWLKPQFGFFTGMGNQHLDLYGSPKALREGETELLSMLPNNGHAYITIDTEFAEYILSRCHCQVSTYSFRNTKADIYFGSYQSINNRQEAIIHYKGNTYPIQSSLIGKHIFMNLLPVIAFSLDQGMAWEKVKASLEAISPLPGKLSLHHGIQGATILNDAVNSNVNGFLGLIETVSLMPQQNKYIISKGIIELGTEKNQSYQNIITAITKQSIQLFTTDPLFQHLGHNSPLIRTVPNEKELMEIIKTIADTQSIIAIEGKFSPSFIRFCIPS